MFYNFANLFFRMLFWLFTRLEIHGQENVPKSGSLMVAMNHMSFLDPVLMGVAVDRRIIWMSKVENWDNPVMGAALTLYGAFPVQRGEVDRTALVRALTILKDGGVLGIAPEGTRSRESRLARARAGAARLAMQTDATVLPVAIAGTELAVKMWPKLRRPHIVVRIGEPFKLQAERPVSKERQQGLADEMMLRIASMLPESYRGVYASGLDGLQAQDGATPQPSKPPEQPN